MKIQPFFLTMQTIILLLFGSCKGNPECPDARESTIYMDTFYKKKLPYLGSDSLYFINDNNDTIECIGRGRITFFESTLIREANPDCNVYHKKNYEGYKDNYINLVIEQSQKPISSDGIWIPRYKISWLNTSFIFNNGLVSARLTDTAPENYRFHDSVEIVGKYYMNVSEITSDKNKIYINNENGILKLFNFNDNLTWSLIKKK